MAADETDYTGHKGFHFFWDCYRDIVNALEGTFPVPGDEDLSQQELARLEQEEDRALFWFRKTRSFPALLKLIDEHPGLAQGRDELTHTTSLHLVAADGKPHAFPDPDGLDAALFPSWRADVVRHLIARGADPNARDEAGNTPLHVAVATITTLSLVTVPEGEKLSDYDDYWYRDFHDWTSVHGGGAHKQIIEALLQRGADPNAPNLKGESPVDFAVERDRGRFVHLLWEMGGDVTSRRRNGRTPRQMAEKNGCVYTLRTIDEIIEATK